MLTDNGVPFTWQPHQWFPGGHCFARVCRALGVEQRLTKPAHPWTNGQVERFNRTLQEATVQRYHYQTTHQLSEHLPAFLLAPNHYNHAKRLKTLRGLPPTKLSVLSGRRTPLCLPATHPNSLWDCTPRANSPSGGTVAAARRHRGLFLICTLLLRLSLAR